MTEQEEILRLKKLLIECGVIAKSCAASLYTRRAFHNDMYIKAVLGFGKIIEKCEELNA